MKRQFRRFIETELKEDVLLITCGLPGTYKTETSEEIARIKGYPIVRTDLIRKEVLKGEDIFDNKVASNMEKRKMVYEVAFKQADEALDKGDSAIIDATFVTQELRKRAAAIAAKYGKTLVVLQTHCTDEVAIGRILKRTKEDYESNALDEQAYINNKKKFEPVNLDDLKEFGPDLKILHITVDTRKDPPDEWYVTGAVRR